MDGAVHRAGGADLPPATLYGLLRLRVDVFVVEQRSAYPELDGRDLDADTVHFWTGSILTEEPRPGGVVFTEDMLRGSSDIHHGAAPLACLRLLTEPTGDRRIGRVCTAAAARGSGLARRLIAAALDEVGDATCVLDAQAHLTRLYGGFGFAPNGPGYDWDGVEHVPMRRAGRAPSTSSVESGRGHGT